MKAFIATLVTALICSAGLAYLPTARLILDKTAKNDGRGLYLIEQEVQFQMEPENIITRETWLVQDGENMQVTVKVMGGTGSTAKPLAIIYRAGTRFSVEAGASPQQSRVPLDAIEPFFHFRSVDGLGRLLIASHMLAQGALSEHRLTTLKNFKRELDSNVMLARVGGSIALALGIPREGTLTPTIWIDQDKFVIRKLKLPSNAEIVADNHEQFAKNLVYPKDRSVNWDDKAVQIRTVSVKSLTDAHGKFNPQTIAAEEKLTGALPAAPVVREFYSRFR